MIELDPEAYLSWGGNRLIFEHPHDRTKLLKVLKPNHDNSPPRQSFRGRAGKYTGFIEEINEYAVLRSRHNNSEPLVAPIHGFAETSLGFGLVVERVSGPDGNLALTLNDMVRENQMTPELRASIDELANKLAELHVVVSDFAGRNLVLRPDGQGFCIIDGLGDPLYFGLRKKSHWLWRLSLERKRKQIQSRISAGKGWKKRDKRGPRWREDVDHEKSDA